MNAPESNGPPLAGPAQGGPPLPPGYYPLNGPPPPGYYDSPAAPDPAAPPTIAPASADALTPWAALGLLASRQYKRGECGMANDPSGGRRGGGTDGTPE